MWCMDLTINSSDHMSWIEHNSRWSMELNLTTISLTVESHKANFRATIIFNIHEWFLHDSGLRLSVTISRWQCLIHAWYWFKQIDKGYKGFFVEFCDWCMHNILTINGKTETLYCFMQLINLYHKIVIKSKWGNECYSCQSLPIYGIIC